jgi:hypothetical protein
MNEGVRMSALHHFPFVTKGSVLKRALLLTDIASPMISFLRRCMNPDQRLPSYSPQKVRSGETYNLWSLKIFMYPGIILDYCAEDRRDKLRLCSAQFFFAETTLGRKNVHVCKERDEKREGRRIRNFSLTLSSALFMIDRRLRKNSS